MRQRQILSLLLIGPTLSGCVAHYSASQFFDELNRNNLKVRGTYQGSNFRDFNSQIILAEITENNGAKVSRGSLIIQEFRGRSLADEAFSYLLYEQEKLKDFVGNSARPSCYSQKFMQNKKAFLDKCHYLMPTPGMNFFQKANLIVVALDDVSTQGAENMNQVLQKWKQ